MQKKINKDNNDIITDNFYEPLEYDNKEFNAIHITMASPEKILSWSYGEVTRPDTINYRTLKPDRSGLFCAKIFGPMQNYTCICGKYKKHKFHGIVCEKCGVEVTTNYVRRSRMGHITLANPVVHTLHMRSVPSRVALALDISTQELNQIVYLDAYVVIDEGLTDVPRGMIIDQDKVDELKSKYGDEVIFETGAVAILEMLKRINLSKEIEKLDTLINQSKSCSKIQKYIKRKSLLESFESSGNKLDWMVLTHLPVLPPELRPLVPIEGLRFASSDLNDLYRRIINRNNRLKHLYVIDAPLSVIKSEKRMLQESVDALFANGKNGKLVLGSNGRPLKSLEDSLKGKKGRFRHNLLGKRVDYSGRSVISVGPSLKLHQCGLPKQMALELFRPFVYSLLIQRGIVSSFKSAKNAVDKKDEVVWGILQEITSKHTILLNRAPTLHRLSIQGFEPVLIDGKAILIHPLVCAAFNADFDGDQMGVYVPICIEAQIEARTLMLATNNLLSPANGNPIAIPTQDYLLGIYWLTLPANTKDCKFYSNIDYVLADISRLLIDIRQDIKVTINDVLVQTTPGRVILYSSCNFIPFEYFNKVIDKSAMIDMVKYACYNVGFDKAITLLDTMLMQGKNNATKLGLSLSTSDMDLPEDKYKLIDLAEKDIQSIEDQFHNGIITEEARKAKIIAKWISTGDQIGDLIKVKEDAFSSMIASGARGSKQQLKQLCGMKGLMSKPNGEIIEAVIKSSFKEGLNILEYFISTHGTRKGLTDTALQTAKSGYLYRKLFDIAHSVIIAKDDCGTDSGILGYYDSYMGRCLSQDLIVQDKIFVKNTIIDSSNVDQISKSNNVYIRSPVTCQADQGICKKCYGLDLSTNKEPNIGVAAGVIAAQSIGEPGTQLTMRSFHSGGTASLASSYTSIIMPKDGYFKLEKCSILKNKFGINIVNSRKAIVVIFDTNNNVISEQDIPYGAYLSFAPGSNLYKGQEIASWNILLENIYCEVDGFIKYINIFDNPIIKEVVEFGYVKRIVVDSSRKIPTIAIVNAKGDPIFHQDTDRPIEYYLRLGACISNLEDGQEIFAGDVLASYDRSSSQTADIVGGLSQIIDLFESRTPGSCALIAKHQGVIDFSKDVRNKIIVNILGKEGDILESFQVSKTMNLLIKKGDTVEVGDKITEGSLSYQDLLDCMGIEYLTQTLLKDAQSIYKSYNIKIDNKHLEIIFRQMLRYGIYDQHLDGELVEINNIKDNSKFKRVILGATRSALETQSFLSAASFQETSRILLEAAVKGKIDRLLGLKENTIVGRLNPVGTGFAYYKKANELIE